MNRKLYKEIVEKVTGRGDAILFTAETLGISKNCAAMKLSGKSDMSIGQACVLRDALHMTSAQFTKIFLEA